MKIAPVMPKPQHRREYKPISALLRRVREGVGLSQQALATKLRWPQSKAHKSEDGSRRVDFGEFVAWMHACGKDPHWALDEYLKASATVSADAKGKWPMEAHETPDQEAKERKVVELLGEMTALLKKDRRKGARKTK